VRDEVRDRVEALLRREGWTLSTSNSRKEGAP